MKTKAENIPSVVSPAVEALPVQDNGTEERRPKKEKARKKEKGKGATTAVARARGVDTMFRTSYRTHVDLSGLADNKANIMISINGLIISVVLAGVVPRIASEPWMLVPVSALLITCVSSMVYAVLCARPRVSVNPVTLEDVRQNMSNILFFGHFVNMTEKDYETGMTELMSNSDQLYANMIRDLYGLGQVLAKKFQLLRVAYTIFMIGLVISVALFILFFILATTT